MEFEEIVKQYLNECNNVSFYAAGIYNTDVFAARAIMYTINMKEYYCNSSRYSETQIEEMTSNMAKLSDESLGLTAIRDSISFFKSLKK